MMPLNQQYGFDQLQPYHFHQQVQSSAPSTLYLQNSPQAIPTLDYHHVSLPLHTRQNHPQSQLRNGDLSYDALGSQSFSYSHSLSDALENTPNLYHLSQNSTPTSTLNSSYVSLALVPTPVTVTSQLSGNARQGRALYKCMCKQNPNRIPRPRNAFILFRQKYHQSVLDEATETKTNPEVSRELGRRWRALPPAERDHWNNLAEEEKTNHAKKYPNYRYMPRRNGKNKNCPVCHLKSSRQSSAALPPAHYMGEPILQKLPLVQPAIHQAQQQDQQEPSQQTILPANGYLSQMGQYMFPYQQMGSQFGFGDQMLQFHGQSFSQGQQGTQNVLLLQQQPLQQPPQQPQQQQQYAGMQSPITQYGSFDLGHIQQQRVNSLPNPTSTNSYYGYDVFYTANQYQH